MDWTRHHFSHVILATVVVLALVTTFKRQSNLRSQVNLQKVGTLDDVSISIKAVSPDYSTLASESFLPWDAVIEPHKDQMLLVSAFSIGDEDVLDVLSDDNAAVTWTICGTVYSGQKTIVNIAGTFVTNITVTIDHDEYSYSRNFTLGVKYVRREFRTLTETDRNAFLSALEVMYTINMAEGQKLYGDKYVDAEYLLYRHLNGAARNDCDHWHDGAGFPISHTAITLQAEQALQSVDPSIAMPYWEYAQVHFPSFAQFASYFLSPLVLPFSRMHTIIRIG